jgi:hypothetical protein
VTGAGPGPTRVALVPGVLALLPEYAGLEDPVADLRSTVRTAASWLAEVVGPVAVIADEQGARVGRHLLAEAGATLADGGPAEVAAYLVVANGSARRNEHAPGYVDQRAVPFDAAVEAALRGPDPDVLAGLDVDTAAELLCGGVAGLVLLGTLLRGAGPPMVDYADDPYGVQYWTMRWESATSEGKWTADEDSGRTGGRPA